METKAILCLLAVSLVQGSVISPSSSSSSSLSGSLSSIMSDPSPISSLSAMRQSRIATADWDKEYNFNMLGLHLKIKFVDPATPLKGAHVFAEFAVPKMLKLVTMGVSDIQLDIMFTDTKDITEGLFDIKVGYKIIMNAVAREGTVDIFRKMESGKYITKIIVNGLDTVLMDLTLDTDYKNKILVSATIGGKAYSLRINRVRGTSMIAALTVDGTEYTIVVNPNTASNKISIHTLSARVKTHEAEIIYNPISSEWGIYITGEVFGPFDCRFILQKDFKFGQVIINHNKVNYAYVNMEGRIAMADNLMPKFFKYAISYDLNQGKLGEGKAKINFNALDVEKILTISVAPKTGHAYDWEIKGKMDADYSFEVSHELVSGSQIYYTMSHKHTVAFNTAEKWMSLQKDKCAVPKTSPLYTLLDGTYLGDLLFNMQRKMAINIDWRVKNGLLYKIDYKDTLTTGGAKHLVVSINTQNSPINVHMYYPKGPEIRGMNLGMNALLGKDSINCEVLYTPAKEVVIKTDISNMKISLRLPNLNLKPVFSVVVTYTAQNEKVFECAIYKDGLIYKVNLFSSFFTPKNPALCTTTTESCYTQWSSYLNFDVDLASRISGLVPVHSLTMGLTMDYETLIEVQHSIKQSPHFLRITCPHVLPKQIDVTITHVVGKPIIIKVADYIPGEIEVEIVNTAFHIKYEGYELVCLDLNTPKKMLTIHLPLLQSPTCTIMWVKDDLLKNKVTVTFVLPVLGKVLDITVDWLVKDITDCTIKAALVGDIPVVGAFTVNEVITYQATLPQGTAEYTLAATFTKGLLAYLPPLETDVTVKYDLTTKTVGGKVSGTVSGQNVGITVNNNHVAYISNMY